MNPDALPPEGGRWIRDPETGALTPAPEPTEAAEPPAQEQ